MKKSNSNSVFLALFFVQAVVTPFAAMSQHIGNDSPQGAILVSLPAGLRSASEDASLVINGTNATATFKVSTPGLTYPVSLTTPPGFTVTPKSVNPNVTDAEITVTYNKYNNFSGLLKLSSGEHISFISLTGKGSKLPGKDISANPAFDGGGSQDADEFVASDFNPGPNGYTIEFKVKTNTASKSFYPLFNDASGKGFKGYVTESGVGIYANATLTRALEHPTQQSFYNDADLYHVYRYAVAPDGHVFFYRDGIPIDTLRLGDYSLPDLLSEAGEPTENMIMNGNFEGEYNFRKDGYLNRIENWTVVNWDTWNNNQAIELSGIGAEYDAKSNHVLEMSNYQWSTGWGAGEIDQVVDIVSGTTYSFSAMAKGGQRAGNAGTEYPEWNGKFKIREVQDETLGASVNVTSNNWQIYTMDYTPTASCRQLKITLYMERNQVGWTTSGYGHFFVDNVALTGQNRINFTPMLGFINDFANIHYFAYDLTGAYAPPETGIKVDTPSAVDIVNRNDVPSVQVVNGLLYLSNVPEVSNVSVYTSAGILVEEISQYSGRGIPLRGKGVYIVKVGNRPKAIKVIY
ncbi:MAG: hypothetical protein LBD45_04010 [Bacteroidales bacterium]|jgi:hypothetical protein|nr:hypothetical protein [Bacteroidales bacterium]